MKTRNRLKVNNSHNNNINYSNTGDINNINNLSIKEMNYYNNIYNYSNSNNYISNAVPGSIPSDVAEFINGSCIA